MKRLVQLCLASFIGVVLLAGSAVAVPNVTKLGSIEMHPIDRMTPNGKYIIQVKSGEKWLDAGSLDYDKFMRERKLDLTKFISGKFLTRKDKITLRIIQKGGGAAHIDSVTLGGIAPVKVKGLTEEGLAEENLTDGLKKIIKKENDVADAFNKTVELEFPASGKDRVLILAARIESKVISKRAFLFPRENLRRRDNKITDFYSYTLDKGDKDTYGKSYEKSYEAKPFFSEVSVTGSGHPNGITYGWVRNDEKNLYVKIDFTPDNTMDGEKDYAKVYVNTGSGVKEFKLSVPEQKWGKPSFTYTNKVKYQHKVYDFTIPLKELGISKGDTADELKLAFAAYGTAAAGDYYSDIAYDPVNDRYLVVFEDTILDKVTGQLINADGTLSGSIITISTNGSTPLTPTIAYDSVNERFLVTWSTWFVGTDYDIYGQLVNANGTLSGSNFLINESADDQTDVSTAYDSVNQRFLVAWDDYRTAATEDPTRYDIYGQLVTAAGGMSGAEITICIDTADQYNPSVDYDSATKRFLVAWQDARNVGSTENDIYGQLVNAAGTLYNANFEISTAADAQASASIAYDSTNQRFLVTWTDNRNVGSTGNDIYGQLVTAAGGMVGSDFSIAIAANTQQDPSADYDSFNQRFLVAWEDNRGANSDVYGQLVNTTGGMIGTNFEISTDGSWGPVPSVAFNSACPSFMVSHNFISDVPPSISYSLIGDTCTTFEYSGGTASYEMMSFPMVFADTDAVSNLGPIFDPSVEPGVYNSNKWRIYTYSSGSYVQPPDSLTNLVPGRGYWIVSLNTAAIDLNGTPVDPKADYTVTLTPGWSMVGNPFTFTLNASDLLVDDGSTPVSVSGGTLTKPDIYFWQSGAYATSSQMLANRAYWIKNTTAGNITLTIPPTVAAPAPAPQYAPAGDDVALPEPPGAIESKEDGMCFIATASYVEVKELSLIGRFVNWLAQ